MTTKPRTLAELLHRKNEILGFVKGHERELPDAQPEYDELMAAWKVIARRNVARAKECPACEQWPTHHMRVRETLATMRPGE